MPVTLVLIAISVVVTLVSSFGDNTQVLQSLYISNYTWAGLREVFQGQVWRLITPIFVHFGLLPNILR